MIDYEKLKLIHELTNKIDEIDEVAVQHHFSHTRGDKFILWTKNGVAQFGIEEMDDLIAKLKELVKPEAKLEPKYKVGDEVWYKLGDELISCEIIKNPESFGDDYYPSKEALIEAQIEYWKNQLENNLEKVKECSHVTLTVGCAVCDTYKLNPDDPCYKSKNCEHEGKIVYMDGPTNITMECIKCGEFYR